MSNDKGIRFSLGGSKRSASGRPLAPPPPALPKPSKKAPVSVVDVFASDSSDDERDEVQVDAKKARREISVSAHVCAPSDPEVKRVAERLAEFVAKNGRNYEEITRQRNPGETPFKFLFHRSSAEYMYYDSKVKEFLSHKGKAEHARDHFGSGSQRARSQTPILPQPAPNASHSHRVEGHSGQRRRESRFSAQRPRDPEAKAKAALAAGDSVAAMNAFMQLAARKDETKQSAEDEAGDGSKPNVLLNDTAFEKRRTYAVYRDDGSRGHHMQDFIPAEELAKFMSKCSGDEAKATAEAMEARAKISSDNIGHKLLSRMGWKEGEGLGAQGKGISRPVEAGSVKSDNLGLGAQAVGDVSAEDDVYEQYRKRMMLGYKYRPNPLGNPRRTYY